MTEVRVVKKRKDFIKVAKQGEKVVQPTLILQAAFNPVSYTHLTLPTT